MLTTPLTGCYHKPEFKGQVIDAENKQPIEGAVVVAVYSKMTMGIPEHYSSIINVRETLTDKEGKFRIPSYTTIIQPFSWGMSWGERANFIIFKPGYGSFPNRNVYPFGLSLPDQEIFFSAGIGAERLLSAYDADGKYGEKMLKMGIVELPKLKTREEMIKRMLGFPTGYGVKNLPLLYKAYEDEQNSFKWK
jgi:hypothetical protein